MNESYLSFQTQIEQALEQRRTLQRLRQRKVVASPQGAAVDVDGRRLRCFCSNDYLGLANHPRMIAAMQRSADQFGVGGGASHLVSGHSIEHHRLEEAFAARTQRDAALYFSSGFMANMGILTALLDKPDAVFEDKLNHASLIDGGLLSGARFQRFLHNDMNNLDKRLGKTQARRKLVCVDGVFSMDGDKADLPGLASLAQQHNALLMVDDAHGFGVLGESGAGLCEEQGVSQAQAPVLMCTLGKAIGSYGALVAGPQWLIDALIQFARSYIYTTSTPPPVAAAALEAFSLLDDEAWRRDHLHSLIQQFREGADAAGLSLMPSQTAIQPLLIGSDADALAWQAALEERGFWISAIRPPTVPEGSSRLRITLSAAHSIDDVDALLEVLIAVKAVMPQPASEGAA
ncbi:8-amino-7-oxononanoate synthase 2 [BD1-7 clade bacterium]|uniref:8-amino-7-oxononanoate synthase n=1 Tax=BD1-7 clade bacterium TaxID=2029982 RepID=A0A5S9Q8C9_9GAMM|nr:8-amino-7-oxononanoate synthase 2 [BD1-7 clade bacterium]CAA0114232.1 8-amino-7-oxononanoate synthase 2 [BD1-7 clade bacterium]